MYNPSSGVVDAWNITPIASMIHRATGFQMMNTKMICQTIAKLAMKMTIAGKNESSSPAGL